MRYSPEPDAIELLYCGQITFNAETAERSKRHCFRFRPVGPASQRKNTMMSAAGMNGPHQRWSPNAPSVVDPAFTNSMIDPAQASVINHVFTRRTAPGAESGV